MSKHVFEHPLGTYKSSLCAATINLGEIRYLEVPDIIDYKLVHDSEIQIDGYNRLDDIHQ